VIGGVFGDHKAMTKTARVLMACAVASLSACHRNSDPEPAAAPAPRAAVPVPVKKGPNAAELTRGMVEAASQGKSQLPVQLKFDLLQRPTVGQTLDISVAVLPQIDANGADILVAGGEGLTVAPGENPISLAGVQAGEVYRQSVRVTPTATGVLLLNLTVSLKHDEIIESRAFSIPLIVER
jgi:hypothetical protein